jgi:hypothetical protein
MLISQRTSWIGAGVITLCAAANTLAGPEWMEMGEAGNQPANAQAVTGNGSDPVTKITGRLSGTDVLRGSSGMFDFQDMYLIKIVNPEGFRASTLGDFGGFAGFDAQLFLFKVSGEGLLANLNVTTFDEHPLLLPFSNDGTEVQITSPGLYLLAISGFPSFPRNPDGPLFHFDTQTEVSGPDGNGGSGPINAWTGPGEDGRYSIGLVGVVGIPVNELGCNEADIAEPYGVLDFSDVLVFLSQYGAGILDFTDLAPPFGVLDFSDITAFLTAFAQGC